jgi:hypothetical protein
MARVTISSNNLFPGPRGAQGPAGPSGGPAGPTGPEGPQGNAGPAGAQGIQGPAGPTGAGGAQGLKGDTGNKGDTGDTGAAGTNGTNGTNGAGVVVGGTTGQALLKIDGTDYNTQWTTIPLLTTANTFTGGVQQITTASAATVGLIVKGSASQSANLMEFKDSASTSVLTISPVGAIRSASRLSIGNIGIDFGVFSLQVGSAATIGAVIRGAASQTGNLQEWQNSAGSILAQITSAGDLVGNSLFAVRTRYILSVANTGAYLDSNSVSNSLVVFQRVTTAVNLIVRGVASQTANLQEWQESGAQVRAYIMPGGFFRVRTSDTSSASIVVGPASTSQVPLIVEGLASQTGNLQQWRNSAGTVQASIASNGDFTNNGIFTVYGRFGGAAFTDGASLRVNGYSTSVVTSVFKAIASQTSNITEWQNSGATVLTAVNASGTINFASGNTSATANTGAVALPALAVGFITMQVAGTTVKVPYYAN